MAGHAIGQTVGEIIGIQMDVCGGQMGVGYLIGLDVTDITTAILQVIQIAPAELNIGQRRLVHVGRYQHFVNNGHPNGYQIAAEICPLRHSSHQVHHFSA